MALTTVPASLSATALTLTTAAQPNITSLGTLTGLTVSGNIAGTLTTAAQTNITSLGTLSALAVSGDLTIADKIIHSGDTDTFFRFAGANDIRIVAGNVEHAAFDVNTIVFNQSGANMDFRVESTGNESMLHVDAGNDRVGIGTNSPTEALTIKGDGLRMAIESADYENVMIGRRGSSGADLDKGYLRMKAAGVNKVILDTAGDSYLMGGNVGIGSTSAPPEKLHVYTTGNSRVEVESTTGVAAFKATNNSGSYAWYVDNTADKFHLYDFTDSAQRVTLDGSGNVGIGSDNPLTKLHVRGTSTTDARLLIEADSDTAGGEAKLQFKTDSQDADTRIKAAIIFKRDNPGTRGTGDLHFAVEGNNSDTNASTSHTKLIIQSGGNVGIGGTSNINSKLSVFADGEAFRIDGTANTTRRIRFRNAGAGSGPGEIVADGSLIIKNEDANAYLNLSSVRNIEYQVTSTNSTAGHHIFTSYGTEIMRIDGASNFVGIGTGASVGGKLHVKAGSSGSSYSPDGADQVIFENSGSLAVDIRTPSSDQGLILFSDNGARARGILGYYHQDDYMYINTAGGERMRINDAGNVRIGTGDPLHPLHISNKSGQAHNGIRIDNTTSYYGQLNFYTTGGNRRGFVQSAGNGNLEVGTDSSSGNVQVYAGGQIGLEVHNTTRNIGAGVTPDTSASGYKFKVYSGDYLCMKLRAPTYPTLRFEAINQNSGNNASIGVGASNSVNINPNNTTVGLSVTNSGAIVTANQPSSIRQIAGGGLTSVNCNGQYYQLYFNTNWRNVGSMHSQISGGGSKFTAPVAGVYFFQCQIRVDAFSGNYFYMDARVNGTTRSRDLTSHTGSYLSYHVIGTYYLNVGDYFTFEIANSGDTSVNIDDASYVSIHLLG